MHRRPSGSAAGPCSAPSTYVFRHQKRLSEMYFQRVFKLMSQLIALQSDQECEVAIGIINMAERIFHPSRVPVFVVLQFGMCTTEPRHLPMDRLGFQFAEVTTNRLLRQLLSM